MLWLIIRKEIVHNILSFRFIVTYALLFCMILLAVFLMTNDYRARQQDYATELSKERRQVDELEKIDDHQERFERFREMVFSGMRPPRNLSILARGLEGDLPSRTVSNSWRVFRSSEERLGKNMLFEIFQTPDFVYVINIVMSLLALLFVFDAVCGEKERGTLKLLLANAVPRDIVLVGKWIGGFISVAAPFSVAVLGGYVYIYLSGALDPGGDGTSRFLLIFALSLVYISAFFTLGLLISVLTHRTSTALLVSLMVWIGWILVVPNVAPIVARLAAPVPSRQVIDGEKQAIERESQLLQQSIAKRKVYGDQDESQRIQREADEQRDDLEEFYRDRMRAQVVLSQNLARLSPSASFLFAATRLAGTGPDLATAFLKAQERYQEDHRNYLNKVYRTGVEFTQQGMQVKDEDWFKADELPRFQLMEERLGDSFNAALFDVLLLVVFNVLFFMLAFVFFLRYDIT